MAHRFNISTCICVDTTTTDANVLYPLMGNVSSDGRRLHYWRLAMVMMLSSKLCNPNERHIVFTNDKAPVVWEGTDILALLKENGVEIHDLPFVEFKMPPGISNKFTNTYYRYEIYGAMAKLDAPTILLDSDVVWAHRNIEFEEAIASGKTMYYDIYQRSATPDSRQFLGTSMRDFGAMFKELDPEYPNPTPISVGGEVVAASPVTYKEIHTYLYKYFWEVVKRAQEGTLPGGVSQRSLIDSDETLISMAVGRRNDITWVNPYIKRMYNLGFINNLKRGDEQKAIWHLPGEKHRGLANLYAFIVERDPRFWSANQEDRATFMGEVLAVPKRRIRRDTDPSYMQEKIRILRGMAGMARNKMREILGIRKH